MVAGSEQWSIQEGLLEPGIEMVRCSEISLVLVVEACNGPDVAYEMEDDLVSEESSHECYPEIAQVVLDINVVVVGGLGTFVMVTSSSGPPLQGTGEILSVGHVDNGIEKIDKG